MASEGAGACRLAGPGHRAIHCKREGWVYTDVLILLLFAVLLVAIFRRLGQPVILAYLFVGV